MDIHVRVATPEDFEEIMRLAVEVANENGVSQPDLNKVASDIWPSLHQDYGIIGVIGNPGEKLEGFVLLRIGQTWYSDAPMIEERTVFVSSEYRAAKGGRARRLCEFSKKVSQDLDMPLLIGILSNQRTKAKVELYKRVFGEPAGAFWLHNAKTGEWAHREAAE